MARTILELELLAGEAGLDRRITHQRIQKPGFRDGGLYGLHPSWPGAGLRGVGDHLPDGPWAATRGAPCWSPSFAHDITCIAVTKGLVGAARVARACVRNAGVPLLLSPLLSSIFIDQAQPPSWMRILLRSTTVHAVLVDVLGVGVLIRGPSGIGKSECALDLVMRGHRLVSDDIVEVQCRQGEVLVGRGPELMRSHMEVRGLGIINIAHLFGVGATRQRKRLEMVVDLQHGHSGGDCERLGLDQELHRVARSANSRSCAFRWCRADRSRTSSRWPRDRWLLRLKGLHPAADINERLQAAMANPQFPHWALSISTKGISSERCGIVVISGMSGAGKSSALNAFEDIGYYCVDNLPPPLMDTFVGLCQRAGPGLERTALAVDARTGGFLDDFADCLAGPTPTRARRAPPVLRRRRSRRLVQRFSETRRPHPVASSHGRDRQHSAPSAKLLAPIRDLADDVIDTTEYSVRTSARIPARGTSVTRRPNR